MFRWLLCLLWVVLVATRCAAADRPNVLMILVDDLKPALGCYGDASARAPNIDSPAARGMRFDLAYCNQAVCAPSRFTLMLGSHSTSTGLYGLSSQLQQVMPHAVTIPQHFALHCGYRTESGLPAPTGPQPIDGVSLVPVLKNPDARVRDHACHAYPKGKLGRAIRTERYRLVDWRAIGEPVSSAEYELHDYAADPLESRKFAAANPAIVSQLMQKLASYPEPVRRPGQKKRTAALRKK